MAISFNVTASKESLRDIGLIEEDLVKLRQSLPAMHTSLRNDCTAMVNCKLAQKKVDRLATVGCVSLEQIASSSSEVRGVINSVMAGNKDYSLHDIHSGLEGAVEDYSKKITTFVQTMTSTVKQYSTGLFDFFIKKLRVNKSIDTSRFVEIDTSMRMVVMTYGDYCEIGNPIVDGSKNQVKALQAWLNVLGRIRNEFSKSNDDGIKAELKNLTEMLHDGEMMKYLKTRSLVELTFGEPDVNGIEGLVKVVPSNRFNNLEVSQTLLEAGWTDVDQVKESLVLKNAEGVSRDFRSLYQITVDIMDEVRRISTDYCTKDPYVFAALVKYASLVAQMVNIYTKAFDLSWTTAMRVCQACLIEQR